MARVIDVRCPGCQTTLVDQSLKVGNYPPCPSCGETMERWWMGSTATPIGDECDVWIRHGICNLDNTPRRYTSKSEMVRVAKERGLVNLVEHIGRPGSDKSPHTVKWF